MPENKEQEVINHRNCVMIYAMEIIGGKWRLPIIWRLYQNKTMRYNEIKRNLVGIKSSAVQFPEQAYSLISINT